MFITIRRITTAGFQGFYRNLSVSLSAILVIAIALGAFASMYFANRVLEASVVQLEKKVDINVYFSPQATEATILEIKRSLETVGEVASVEYFSREQALESFKENNASNPDILEALSVLGEENPLGASFNISAREISQYGEIATFLDGVNTDEQYLGAIETINYHQNKQAIEKINTLVDYAYRIGLTVSLILSFLAIVIVYNTIRLTIYTVREEVVVMRLVGASRFFARGPFVVEGALYGLVGTIVALGILWPVLYYVAPTLHNIFVLNVYDVFIQELVLVVPTMAGVGITLGLLSSVLAIRQYLDI